MTSRRRGRVFAVIAVSAATTGVGAAWAGTIPDGDGTIHACYMTKSGELRVIDPSVSSCPKGELPLWWTAGSGLADGSVTTAKLATDAVTSAKIAAGEVQTSDLADGSVTTGKLAGSSVTSAEVANGTVTGGDSGTGDLGQNTITGGTTGNLALKTITNANISQGTVRGGSDVNPGAAANEIADGTITASDLGTGSVRADELQGGAVTTDKQTANAATGSPTGGPLTDGTNNVGYVALNLTDTENHKVLVTGQLNVACSAYCDTIPGTLQYQLFVTATTPDTGEPIGTQMAVPISQGDQLVLPLSALDTRAAAAGGQAWTYFVRINAYGTGSGASVMKVPVTAVDLGRA